MTRKSKEKANQAKNVESNQTNGQVTTQTAPQPAPATVSDAKQPNDSIKVAPVKNVTPNAGTPVSSTSPTAAPAAKALQESNPQVKSNTAQQSTAPTAKPQPRPKPAPKSPGVKPATGKVPLHPTDLPPKPKRTHRGRRKKKPSSVSESASNDEGNNDKSENENVSKKISPKSKEDITKENVVIKKSEELQKQELVSEPNSLLKKQEQSVSGNKNQSAKKEINKDEKNAQQTKKNNNSQKNKAPEAPKLGEVLPSTPATDTPKEQNKSNQKSPKPKVPPNPAGLAEKVANNKKQPPAKPETKDVKPEVKQPNLKGKIVGEKGTSSAEVTQSKNQNNKNKKKSGSDIKSPDSTTPLQKPLADIKADSSKVAAVTEPQSLKANEPQKGGRKQSKTTAAPDTKAQISKVNVEVKTATDPPKLEGVKSTKQDKVEKPANKQKASNNVVKQTVPVSKNTVGNKTSSDIKTGTSQDTSLKITDIADLVIEKLSELKALEEKKTVENKSNVNKKTSIASLSKDSVGAKNVQPEPKSGEKIVSKNEKKADNTQVIKSTQPKTKDNESTNKAPNKIKDKNENKRNNSKSPATKTEKNVKPESQGDSVLLKGTLIIKPEPEKPSESKKSNESYASKAQSKNTKVQASEVDCKSDSADKKSGEIKQQADKSTPDILSKTVSKDQNSAGNLITEVKQGNESSQLSVGIQKNEQKNIKSPECATIKQSKITEEKLVSSTPLENEGKVDSKALTKKENIPNAEIVENKLQQLASDPLIASSATVESLSQGPKQTDTIIKSGSKSEEQIKSSETKAKADSELSCSKKPIENVPSIVTEKSKEVGDLEVSSKHRSTESLGAPPGIKLEPLTPPACPLRSKIEQETNAQIKQQPIEKQKERKTSESAEESKPQSVETSLISKEHKNEDLSSIQEPRGKENTSNVSAIKGNKDIVQLPIATPEVEIKSIPVPSVECVLKSKEQPKIEKQVQSPKESQRNRKPSESKEEIKSVESAVSTVECSLNPNEQIKREKSPNKQQSVEKSKSQTTPESKVKTPSAQLPADLVEAKQDLTSPAECPVKSKEQPKKGKSPSKQISTEKQKERKSSENKEQSTLKQTSGDSTKIKQELPASSETLFKPEGKPQIRAKSPNKQKSNEKKDRKSSESKDDKKIVQTPINTLEIKKETLASVPKDVPKTENEQKMDISSTKQQPAQNDKKRLETKEQTTAVPISSEPIEIKQAPIPPVESLLKPESQQKRGKSPNKQKPIEKQKDRKASETKDDGKIAQPPPSEIEEQPLVSIESSLKPEEKQKGNESPNKQKPIEKQKDKKNSESKDESKILQSPIDVLEVKQEPLPSAENLLKPGESQKRGKSPNKQKQRDRKTSESKSKEAIAPSKPDLENKKEPLTPTDNQLKPKDQPKRGKSPNKQKPVEKQKDRKSSESKDKSETVPSSTPSVAPAPEPVIPVQVQSKTQGPEAKNEPHQPSVALSDIKQLDNKSQVEKQVTTSAAITETIPVAPLTSVEKNVSNITESKVKDSQINPSEIVPPSAKKEEVSKTSNEESNKPKTTLLESGLNLAGALLGFGPIKSSEDNSPKSPELEKQPIAKPTKKKQNKPQQEETSAKGATSSETSKTPVVKDTTGQLDDSDEDFIEYKFRPRTVYLANACNLCKSRDEKLIPCQHCKMVSYCSEPHRTEDLPNHQQLCIAICEVSKKRGGEHVYDNTKTLGEDDFRNLRVLIVRLCEGILKRPLQPFEREIVLFPRLCCKPSCREWKQENLINCSECGQVSYCGTAPDHLPVNHSIWCQSHLLFYNLIYRQHERGRIEPALPTRILTKPYQLPAKMDDFFKDIFKNNNALKDACQFATLSQLATAPLTALYALQKSSTQITAETFTIHLVGAELQFEADTLDKWEAFMLHLIPGLNNLRIIFIGPELNTENLPLDILSRIRMCRSCRQSCKAVKFEFQCGKLYHEYVNTPAFAAPNLICAFNPGLHRKTGFGGQDTWPDTINAILRQNVPFVSTAYTEHEIPRDLLRIQECAGRPVDVILPPQINPYASLKPDRNFISDEQVPLIFKNFYLTVVK